MTVGKKSSAYRYPGVSTNLLVIRLMRSRGPLVAFLIFTCSGFAHKCVHDEYIAAKNITLSTSPQTYLNHPFSTSKDTNASRRVLSSNWQSLRIHVDSSDLANHNFGEDTNKILHRITSSILPVAIKILTKYLYVIRVDGNLKITPPCLTFIEGKPCCGEDPRCEWPPNTCLDVKVPDAHKNTGIADADFVVYLTANEDENHGHTIAVGGTCNVDQHSRPLAGQVSLNLGSYKELERAIKRPPPTSYLVSLLIHELSHTLGWSQHLFSLFRDENGNFRTNTITTKVALGKTITLLSTPTVKKHLRSHFGCDTLEGMELEDQGGQTSAGSHPEKRIFPRSYMSGTTEIGKSSYLIDSLALSVFQDTGWYQVKNLDQAGRLSWGRGMGCRVPTHKCNDFGAEANQRGLFCSQARDTCTGNNKHVVGYCNIRSYPAALPSNFQYFSDPTTGGAVPLSDYCPRVTEYADGDCTDSTNANMLTPHSGAVVGQEARCFMSSLGSEQGMSSVNSSPRAQCYRRTCKAEALEILVGVRTISCPVSKQATSAAVDGFGGYIVCPPYAGLTDIRCVPTCPKKDPKCTGIKGSAVDSEASALPPPPARKQTGQGSISDWFKWVLGGNQGNQAPVVVHGRKLLRR